jgi:hypothetical protein
MSQSRGRGAFTPGESQPTTGVHKYREDFAAQGKSVLQSQWDTRRAMSWAPYVTVPSIAIVSKFLPKTVRIKVWIGTFVGYGLISTIMYNTDRSGDEPDGIILVR